jgi:hypothetical protein
MGIIAFVLLCEVIDHAVSAWRTLWEGLLIPFVDWVRYGLFWRIVEKLRLTFRRLWARMNSSAV